ncbi:MULTISPECIES: hypothetical protein [unclassified Kitasatospora]|uniref:hypothetical protein n=1 Tax=unclassified Kitasatospora TaxID=2633591 RepID=UPI00380FFCAD
MFAVLATLGGQINPAAAAVNPPAATSSASAPAGSPTSAPAEQSPGANPGANPSAAPTAGPTATPKADPKAEHEAAVQQLKEADPTGPCPASLTPGTVSSCAIDPNGTVSVAFTVTQPKDLVYIQAVAVYWTVYPQVTAPDGTAVSCDSLSSVLRCATSQAGTYTLQLRNGDFRSNGVSVSYLPLLSGPSCTTVAAADRNLGARKNFHNTLAQGSAGDCYTLDLAADDTLRTYVSGLPNEQIFDATGTELCKDHRFGDQIVCKLTGTAPFRVLVQRTGGDSVAYDLAMERLSPAEGCLTVEPQPFGSAPDLTSTVRCRLLHVTAAGKYSFAQVTADGSTLAGELYTADGTRLYGDCYKAVGCELTPGNYTWALEARNFDTPAFGMVFRSDSETRGCTATKDDGLVSGPAAGTFGARGQADCLTLPTATGNGVYLLNRPPTDGESATAAVFDAAGARQCDNGGYPSQVCKLTGTAPFRLVLTGTPGKAYQLVVHRTGNTAGCQAWPQSPFDGSWGAEFTVTAAVKQACLGLPANQHSTMEQFDYTNTQNRVNASLQVVDPQGTVVCSTSTSSAFSCVFNAGVAYTALLVNNAWGDSYKVVRRDISPTANCLTPRSTAVGGQSLPMDLSSALDARCVRVTAAASDKMWLVARPTGGAVESQVIDANGKYVCTQWAGGVSPCLLTGSTSYTMVVLAAGYNGTTIHANVDTWKVGTASGWAPECTAHQASIAGFPGQSGVFTESSSAYCAVLDMKPSQAFKVFGISSATGTAQPFIRLLSPVKWTGDDYTYQCSNNYGEFGARCQSLSSADAGQAILMIIPSGAATPVEYSIQGSCEYPNCTGPAAPLTVAGASPATGAAGTQVQVEIRGSGLTLGSKLNLWRAGVSTQPAMKPLSVNADGTSLHALVDTNGLEPGSYDIQADGYRPLLANGFTVTAAQTPTKGKFVPVPPSRILNTVSGVGAPAGRVRQGGVVTLQVAGAGGIPASGVTAVVMNVTAVNPTRNSAISVYPSGQAVPDLPTVSFAAGQNVPNLVTVPLSNGKVDLRNAWGEVDLGVDVAGYYTDGGAGSLLSPINPTRILNTVSGVGAPAGRVGWGGVVPLKVTGVAGVPASGVTAVVMSVTAVNPSRTGYVTVYPDGQGVPDASNVNFTAGQNVSNLVTVPVGANGKVDLYNAWGEVDLGVDVVGYYSDKGATYSSSNLVRLMDTRTGEGARIGTLGGAGDVVSLKVAGVEGVPLTGVTEVLMNVTVVWPTNTSFLTVYPHGTGRPDASNINYRPGDVVSALVMVPVVDGRVSFTNQWGSTHVVADLIGYFSA